MFRASSLFSCGRYYINPQLAFNQMLPVLAGAGAVAGAVACLHTFLTVVSIYCDERNLQNWIFPAVNCRRQLESLSNLRQTQI